MNAIQQAIESLGLEKRCFRFCMMCDLGLQDKFDSATAETRGSFIDALAESDWETADNTKAALGLILLLSHVEFDQFIAKLVQRAPFSTALAWRIIRSSSNSPSKWFIERGKAPYQRHFHLHPMIAPLLLKAAICPASNPEDTIALFEFFEPVAHEYSVLKSAIPLWHAELERRFQERHEQAERENTELLRQESQQAARLAELNAIQRGGSAAIINSLAENPAERPWDFPVDWAQIPDKELLRVPQKILEQALMKVSSQARSRCWKSLSHKIRSALKTIRRESDLAQLEDMPLLMRLQTACNSRWSLTYFPEKWAHQILQEAIFPDELRSQLLSKLMRLKRRNYWQKVHHKLLQ